MDKSEVITEYCKLSAQVAEGVFHYKHAADCFCGSTASMLSYQYEDAVLNYIREAVHQRMRRESHSIPTVR